MQTDPALKTCAARRALAQAVRPVLGGGFAFLLGAFLPGPAAAAQPASEWKLPRAVQVRPSKQVRIDVDLHSVARSAAPDTLFGFNVPWMNFQRGYWRQGQVRPEVIDWLKPFRGAVYRYPGGSWSNSFEWKEAVGPLESRALQYTYSGPTKAEFGFGEFLDFVKAVEGVPLVTTNLKGTRKTPWNDAEASRSNAEWVQYAVQREGKAGDGGHSPFCQEGKKCPVEWWELGNELDWGEEAWTGEQYASRARAVGQAMKKIDPGISLIAHTASSPWSAKRTVGTKEKASEFDRAVGRGLGDITYGYAYHPYYDGMSVPAVNDYMVRAANNLAVANAPPRIFITEHGRWPSRPKFGKWQTNWVQTGNLGGAVATADYLLSQTMIPNVQATMWHALGALGPWQLFYLDPDTDELFPSVVYWGLRVLREGLLDDAMNVNVSSPNTTGYRGGYDVRAVFMREGAGTRYSLMTVNRSAREQQARLSIPQWAGRSVNARQYYITGANGKEANVKEDKDRVVMQDRPIVIRFDAKGEASVDLPAISVSSVVIN